MNTRLSRRSSLYTQQRNSDIIDVCAGRSCDDQPAHRLKRMIGVVVLQYIKYGDSVLCQRRLGFPVNIAADGISWAIRAVAAHGEYRCAGNACNARSRSKRQFLISTVEAVPVQVHDGFTSCDKGKRFFGLCMAFENTSQKAACLPCLTAKLIGQDDRSITELLRSGSSGGTELTHRAVDVRLRIMKLLGCLLVQKLFSIRAELQLIYSVFQERKAVYLPEFTFFPAWMLACP